jgi:secreted protein with Ig-like and vWFA domain
MSDKLIEQIKADREAAYQEYINEVTPNGNTRMDNIILSAGPISKHQRHIATQVDHAFQEGWQAAKEADAEALKAAEQLAVVAMNTGCATQADADQLKTAVDAFYRKARENNDVTK